MTRENKIAVSNVLTKCGQHVPFEFSESRPFFYDPHKKLKTFANAEGNNINYLDLLDTAEPAPVGPLDEECAQKYGLQDQNFVFSSTDFENGSPATPNISNTWHYALCLAKKRELLNGCGSINDNHIKNWQKDVRSLGLFDDDFVNRINSTCHQRDLRFNNVQLGVKRLFQSDEPEALAGFIEYIDCLISMIEKFYENLERKKFDEKNDKEFFGFFNSFKRSPNFDLMVEKAVRRIVLKTPDTPNFVFDPTIY